MLERQRRLNFLPERLFQATYILSATTQTDVDWFL